MACSVRISGAKIDTNRTLQMVLLYMPKAVAKSCVNVVAIYLYWHNKLTKHTQQKVEIESADPKHLVHPNSYQ